MKIEKKGDMYIDYKVFNIISDICNSPMGERMVFRNENGVVLCTKANDGDARLGAGSINMFMTIPASLMQFPGEYICMNRVRTFIGNVNAIRYYDDEQSKKPNAQKPTYQKCMSRAIRNGREEVIYIKVGSYELATPLQRVEAFKAEGQVSNKFFWAKGFDRSSVEACRIATFKFSGDSDIDSLHSIAKKVVAPKELCITKPSEQGPDDRKLIMEFSSGSSDSLSCTFNLQGDEVGPSYYEMIRVDEPIKFPFEVLKCAADAGMTVIMKMAIVGGKYRLILEGSSNDIDIVFAVGEKK